MYFKNSLGLLRLNNSLRFEFAQISGFVTVIVKTLLFSYYEFCLEKCEQKVYLEYSHIQLRVPYFDLKLVSFIKLFVKFYYVVILKNFGKYEL